MCVWVYFYDKTYVDKLFVWYDRDMNSYPSNAQIWLEYDMLIPCWKTHDLVNDDFPANKPSNLVRGVPTAMIVYRKGMDAWYN